MNKADKYLKQWDQFTAFLMMTFFFCFVSSLDTISYNNKINSCAYVLNVMQERF